MKDLYYQISLGTGNFIKDSGIVPCIFGQSAEEARKEFHIFIYGGLVHPSEAKNPLFSCRNLISCVAGQFLGKDRDSVRAAHLSEALYYATKELKHPENTDIIVLDGIKFDCEENEFKSVISSLFSILSQEAVTNYNTNGDIAVYCYLDTDEDFELAKECDWGCAVKYFDDNRAVLLYKG